MPHLQLDKIYANEGEKIAENITFEAFLDADYGESHSEWVNGNVYQMTTIEIEHANCFQFLSHLIQIFLDLNGGGRMLSRPVLMYSDKVQIARSPDIQVLLPEHLDQVKQYYVMGPSDLVIEIIAEGSQRLDRYQKFLEYEKAGVPEYWIIDHIHRETLFYQLDSEGIYQRQKPNENKRYYSRVLRGLWLDMPTLWQRPIPTMKDFLDLVRTMK
ncbi:MAG TPA: Uma2 family endonuclease [Aggregatilineales bacterium]|nr:Uma2 family endonuclease [Aggregatilineales bacterium]